MKLYLLIFLFYLSGSSFAQDSTAYAYVNYIYSDSLKPCLMDDQAEGITLADTTWGFYNACKKVLPPEDLKYMWGQTSSPFKWDFNKLRHIGKCKKGQGCVRVSAPIYNKTKEWLIVGEEVGTRHCGSSGCSLYHYVNGAWKNEAGLYIDW